MFNSLKIKTMKTYKSYTNTLHRVINNIMKKTQSEKMSVAMWFSVKSLRKSGSIHRHFCSFHFSYFLFYEVYNLHNLNLFTSILHIKQEQKFERYWIFYHCHNISHSLTVTEMFNDGKIAIYMYNGFHELFPSFNKSKKYTFQWKKTCISIYC